MMNSRKVCRHVRAKYLNIAVAVKRHNRKIQDGEISERRRTESRDEITREGGSFKRMKKGKRLVSLRRKGEVKCKRFHRTCLIHDRLQMSVCVCVNAREYTWKKNKEIERYQRQN